MRKLGFLAAYAMLAVGLAQAEETGTSAAASPPNFGCPGAAYRQLDFWLGKWDVRTVKGELAGNSEITALAEGCIIFESWKGTRGGSGHSINVFDQADGKWHQTWVDSTGDQVHFIGAFANGMMAFASDDISTPGNEHVLLRMTLEPRANGTVQQTGTLSSDGGKTWETRYQLVYTRKP